ncbi:MAG: hypothetical protein OXE46_08825 [Chloroflexi bacterium]|nr:hypothetical protein [Chloroflexota bacterium]
MNRLFALLMLLLLAVGLPVLGHDGEVVISEEDPYWVVDCGALLGEVTVDENIKPLYLFLLYALLGDDWATWDSQWQSIGLKLAVAANQCEDMEPTPDEPEAADASEELKANSPVWDDPDGEERLVALVTSDSPSCYTYIYLGIDAEDMLTRALSMLYRQTFINDCIGG